MEYNCNICKKEYSSYKSLWNHNKKFHNNISNLKVNISHKSGKQKSTFVKNTVLHQDFSCRICNKELSCKQSRWTHEKKCKEKNDILKVTEIDKMKEELNKLKNDMKELSKKPSAININNTMNNIGTVGTVNNINSLGYENIRNNISEKDKMYILTSIMHEEHPITELVRKIYTDEKLKEERNTLLTNLRSKDCLIYKSETNKFEATNKNDHIDNIIETRRNDVVKMYNEFTETSKIKLKPKERQAIEDYLEKIEGIDKKDKKLKAFYEKHKEEIIYIIYNCKEFMGTIRDHLHGLENETIEV
jgi:hypothetical protein